MGHVLLYLANTCGHYIAHKLNELQLEDDNGR